jgi:hypothetical protein
MASLKDGQVTMQLITDADRRQALRVLATINDRNLGDEVQAAIDDHLNANRDKLPARYQVHYGNP